MAPVSSSRPLSLPACESPEGLLFCSVLDVVRCPARDVRPLAVLVRPVVVVRAGAPDDTARAVRDAGTAGGPIDVLVAPTDGRDLDAAEVVRAFDGVPVRDVDALGGPLSCFVGDFVGDLTMLDGRDVLGTGLGLGAFRLLLLVKPASPLVEILPAAGLKLLGRPPGFRAAGFAAAAAGWGSMMVAIMGFTNMP